MSAIKKIRSKAGTESNEKGKLFEQRFCAFMKSDLKFREGKTRGDFPSGIDSKGTEVDVVAEKSSYWGKMLRALCLFSLVCLCYFIYLLGTLGDVKYLMCELSVGAIAIGTAVLSYRLNVEHAWVECKDRKEKTPIGDIQAMINKYEAYQQTNNKKFFFTKKYFVSATGYTDDAYHFAKSKGIICYIEKNGTFVPANYWNI
jgi:hypothetical protein